ncbi:MAG: hypothetical protein Q8N16_01385 [bacterium]|nr:hypothetical protein [bacterium]
MVRSSPHDALVGQVLVATKRLPILINKMIGRLEEKITETTSEFEKTEHRLGILKAELSAAQAALEIAEQEQK